MSSFINIPGFLGVCSKWIVSWDTIIPSNIWWSSKNPPFSWEMMYFRRGLNLLYQFRYYFINHITEGDRFELIYCIGLFFFRDQSYEHRTEDLENVYKWLIFLHYLPDILPNYVLASLEKIHGKLVWSWRFSRGHLIHRPFWFLYIYRDHEVLIIFWCYHLWNASQYFMDCLLHILCRLSKQLLEVGYHFCLYILNFLHFSRVVNFRPTILF